jgi:hypothetical protein
MTVSGGLELKSEASIIVSTIAGPPAKIGSMMYLLELFAHRSVAEFQERRRIR